MLPTVGGPFGAGAKGVVRRQIGVKGQTGGKKGSLTKIQRPDFRSDEGLGTATAAATSVFMKSMKLVVERNENNICKRFLFRLRNGIQKRIRYFDLKKLVGQKKELSSFFVRHLVGRKLGEI